MVNYTSEYTISTWTGFDARVDGYTYLSQEVQNMNIPGVVNRYLFDTISKNPTLLQRPEGVSDFSGGYIKSDFLSQAYKINPETIFNYKDDLKPLQELVDKLNKLNANDYTQGSFDKFQAILNEANELLDIKADEDEPSKEVIDAMVQRLNNAKADLKKMGSESDYNDLQAVIDRSLNIISSNKYTSKFESTLNGLLDRANSLMSQSVSQSKIKELINEINAYLETRGQYKKD
jgi:penicillin-binding protein 1A